MSHGNRTRTKRKLLQQYYAFGTHARSAFGSAPHLEPHSRLFVIFAIFCSEIFLVFSSLKAFLGAAPFSRGEEIFFTEDRKDHQDNPFDVTVAFERYFFGVRPWPDRGDHGPSPPAESAIIRYMLMGCAPARSGEVCPKNVQRKYLTCPSELVSLRVGPPGLFVAFCVNSLLPSVRARFKSGSLKSSRNCAMFHVSRAKNTKVPGMSRLMFFSRVVS